MSIVNHANDAHDRYFELIQRFPRPIHSDEELDEAVAVVDSLLDQPALLPEEEDYLEVLGNQIERYEKETHPVEPLSDADMLAHLFAGRGVTETAVAEATGIALSTISEILNGKRSLNRKHIGKLAAYFGVSPHVFIF